MVGVKINWWPFAFVVYFDRWLHPYDGRVIPIPIIPMIQIKKSCRDDASLLVHELVHVRQLWRTGWLHVLMYWLSPDYRLKAEVEAFREQLRANGGKGKFAAALCLTKNYNLKLPFNIALSLLSDKNG
jgi:hypothetical protein